jgi:hypothetical protein
MKVVNLVADSFQWGWIEESSGKIPAANIRNQDIVNLPPRGHFKSRKSSPGTAADIVSEQKHGRHTGQKATIGKSFQ